MFSIISFGNVRMSSMGKNLVTSYAALGVGLALVLTFGLTAISSIDSDVYDSADRVIFTVTDPDQNLRSKASEAPVPAEPPESSEPSQFYEEQDTSTAETEAPPVPPASPETREDVGAQTGEPSGMGGEVSAPMTAPTQEESGRESYLIATDTPAAAGSFAGILMALPYIAAAAVGSAVFAVTRKRVGW